MLRLVCLVCFFIYPLIKIIHLGQFIVNNYRQALRIINENTGPLAEMMKTLNISSMNDFIRWLDEEKLYLLELKKPDPTDAQLLSIQYVKMLKKLEAARSALIFSKYTTMISNCVI